MKAQRTVILATSISVLEMLRKPKTTMNETSKLPEKWETRFHKEERTVILVLPIIFLEISRKL